MSYLQQERDDAVVLVPEGSAPAASIIWLHGLGADGHDFLPLVPELRLAPTMACRIVFPHAPIRPVTINNGARMRAWYDLRDLSPGGIADENGIRASAALLSEYIRRERDAGIAADRIVIAGFSQGGAIALHTAVRHSERLAGVLALSTYLPLPEQLSEATSVNQQTPILMCHGRYDPILPLQLAVWSRDLLRAHGFAVEWKEYGMEHQVCPQEAADIAAWLQRVLA
jgi:phospholipase/carboxylesterase